MTNTPNLKQYVGEISFYVPYETSIVILASDEDHARKIFSEMFDKRPNLTIAQVSELPDNFNIKFNNNETPEPEDDNVIQFDPKKVN